MKYLEIKLTIEPAEPWKEIYTSMMAEAGCDSFMDGEDEHELLCYIPEKDYKEDVFNDLLGTPQFPEVNINELLTMPMFLSTDIECTKIQLDEYLKAEDFVLNEKD